MLNEYLYLNNCHLREFPIGLTINMFLIQQVNGIIIRFAETICFYHFQEADTIDVPKFNYTTTYRSNLMFFYIPGLFKVCANR